MYDWEIPRDQRESAVMWRNARLSRYFSIGCIFMTEGTLATQCVVGFYKPISYAFESNINATMDWPLYMMGSFPYDVQATPNYQLTMLGQFLSNIFASTSFSSADSFFVVLMLHLVGQLSVLKLALYKLPSEIRSLDDKNVFMDKFAFIHLRHNQLCRWGIFSILLY